MNILYNLKEQGVSESLIKDIEHFRKEYDVKDELKERVTKSPAFFIGKDILEMCITGILEEENILLSGPKQQVRTYYLITYQKFSEDLNGTLHSISTQIVHL